MHCTLRRGPRAPAHTWSLAIALQRDEEERNQSLADEEGIITSFGPAGEKLLPRQVSMYLRFTAYLTVEALPRDKV
ncbi:TPA: hypothetical protein ACH3X3_000192 [Trebouxia sp. C0006]